MTKAMNERTPGKSNKKLCKQNDMDDEQKKRSMAGAQADKTNNSRDADDDDDDDDDDEDGEDMRESRKSKKSMGPYSEAQLDHTMQLVKSFLAENDRGTEKAMLLAKARDNDMSADEYMRLGELIGTVESQKEGLHDKVVKGFTDNEALNAARNTDDDDVAEYLNQFEGTIVKSLQTVAEEVETLRSSQKDFNLLMAQALAQTCQLNKSIHQRLSGIETAPMHAPRSRGLAQPIEKSFLGNQNAPQSASKLEASAALNEMAKAAADNGKPGYSPAGNDLMKAAQHLDANMPLESAMAAELAVFMKNSGLNTH